MYKNLHVLNQPNEGDDLIFEIDASNEHQSVVLKIKEGEKLYKNYAGSFNKAECNYPMAEKEILAIVRGFEKFLIFLNPKPLVIQTHCKVILDLIKKNLSNM